MAYKLLGKVNNNPVLVGKTNKNVSSSRNIEKLYKSETFKDWHRESKNLILKRQKKRKKKTDRK